MVAENEELNEIGGAGGGKLPVGREMSVVDGKIVRVSLDAKTFGARGDDTGKAINGIHGRRAHRGGTAFVEAHFAQADDHSFLVRLDSLPRAL